MCTATDLASCRWNFRSVYTSVLAFFGGGRREHFRELRGQIYQVELIAISEARFSLHPFISSLLSISFALVLFIVILSALSPS